MTELRSEMAQDAVQQGILAWLLKRMKVKKALLCNNILT